MIAGPAFLIGAALLAMVAFGLADFGKHGPSVIIWVTFGVVAGSFIAERIAGKYWRRSATHSEHMPNFFPDCAHTRYSHPTGSNFR